MKIKCYDNETNGKLIFETETHLPNPITSFLIEKGVKDAPEGYFDNSFKGLSLRFSLKPTEEDCKLLSDYLKENPIYDEDGEDKTEKYQTIMLFLGTRTESSTMLSISAIKAFRTIDISYFKNFYESLYDEYADEMENVKILEICE